MGQKQWDSEDRICLNLIPVSTSTLTLTTESLAPSSTWALDGLSCLTFTFIFALWLTCAQILAPSHTDLQSQAMTLFR